MKITLKSAVGVGVAAVGLATRASAQGCVLCYTSLASSGPAALHAFELAMFSLLIPALLLFAGVFLFILRRARAADSPRRLSSSAKLISRWRFSSSSAKPVEGRA
jgi:hypothetical protein